MTMPRRRDISGIVSSMPRTKRAGRAERDDDQRVFEADQDQVPVLPDDGEFVHQCGSGRRIAAFDSRVASCTKTKTIRLYSTRATTKGGSGS